MIQSFQHKSTKKIYEGERVKEFSIELQEIARRKLRMLNNSHNLKDLLIPPSNKLEKLTGNLSGYYSIRVNSQWRIIFQWQDGHSWNVELIDYH